MTDATALSFTSHDTLPAEAALVDAGLGSYNEAAVPVHEIRPLATFRQLPSLYRSLGYEVRLELTGFGAGIVKYTMVREAVTDAEPKG